MRPAPAYKGDLIANADARWLHHSVAALRADVLARGASLLGAWQSALAGSSFVPAAVNLAHYLALRRHDLSALQPALSALGLTSLGRSEARVLTALDALLATLSRLAGLPHSRYPDAAALAAGPALLAATQAALFGPAAPDGPTTRIMVTLPSEAADSPELIGRLLAAGMNCAHDTPAAWAAMIGHILTASTAVGRECRVLMDIAGPKCRIETVQGPIQPKREGGLVLILSGVVKVDPSLATRGAQVLSQMAAMLDEVSGGLGPGTAAVDRFRKFVGAKDGKSLQIAADELAKRRTLLPNAINTSGLPTQPSLFA